jgi:hypothetical protein
MGVERIKCREKNDAVEYMNILVLFGQVNNITLFFYSGVMKNPPITWK